MGIAGRWFRDVFRDAVWEAKGLTPEERATLETYARHARTDDGRKAPEADQAWVTYERIMAMTGISRRARVAAVLRNLVTKGWIKSIREIARRPTLYQLTIPLGSSRCGTTEGAEDEPRDPPVVPHLELPEPTQATSVVPHLDAGSSTSEPETPVGSSNGGTRPLEDLPSPSPSGRARHPAADLIAAATGATDDESDYVLRTIEARAQSPIRDLVAYIRGTNPDDLAELLAAKRADDQRRQDEIDTASRRHAEMALKRRAWAEQQAQSARVNDQLKQRTRALIEDARQAALAAKTADLQREASA